MNSKSIQNGLGHRTWLKTLIVVILITGIFFRFTNLDRKVYSFDESITSLRISGYTWTEMVQQDFQGAPISVEYLQRKYQHINPQKSWWDTVKGLATEEPQLPPLYFVLARFWVQLFGPEVAAIRSLSAWISLLVFPSIYWLCWELFRSRPAGWMAVTITAVSPFHVLYAQEARPYMMFAVLVLLSNAILLRAIALHKSPAPSKWSKAIWLIYAIALTLGMYCSLLFVLVALAHGIYVIITENWRLSKILLAYLLALAIATIMFAPWIFVLFYNSPKIEATVGLPRISLSLFSAFKPLILITCRSFIDTHWAGGIINLSSSEIAGNFIQWTVAALLLLTIAHAIYLLCRSTPKRVWLFVLTGIAITGIVLIAVRGVADRYMVPYTLGIQIAVAYLFTAQILGANNRRQQKLWQLGLIVLISSQIVSCTVSSQSQLWWNKYPSSTKYNPAVAAIVNQAKKPLLISHGGNNITGKILSITYLLKPEVELLLAVKPEQVKIPEGFSDVFLYRSTELLRFELEEVQKYKITPIYPLENVWLWRLEK
ncbi:glycosyltransferase family 39 protein [Microcoleus sp. bin38.metabat.b11b12b14.051]|uniref:glycosyltransferase family 39 protein n=1 Tax=Microcoleus sp. bin38.metabat.b11b12b14.051 TaxID=2742709 RepID=UPI0025F3CB1B|nr:glycosyltransferase family 39 protein [Microcoleus sp. bin38.metabat.b11b12b14.051]